MIWLLLILLVPGGLNYIYAKDRDGDVYIQVYVNPCNDTNITARIYDPFSSYQFTEEGKYKYNLLIAIPDEARHLLLEFDSAVTIELVEPSWKTVLSRISNETYSIRFFREHNVKALNCSVFGHQREIIPYVRSIFLNERELCKNPQTVPNTTEEKTNAPDIVFPKDPEPLYLSILADLSQTEELRPSQEQTCGKQKVLHTALIVHGQSTKSGHWPWHVAIFRMEKSSLKYICGGTLLSKTLVLTAAHCATIKGSAIVPEALRVDLGKLNLFGGDVGTQEREVFQVIMHPKYDIFTQGNDIALLKLKSEAVFTDYVQPACLWNEQASKKLPNQSIFGTVVGWGFDHQNSLSSTLKKITIPIQSELICLKSNPAFYHQRLNNNKFCAGFGNGSSVCNGDSGGGLMVFVTDTPGGTASGAWYVRGIVSIAPTKTGTLICDPNEFTIFTNVDKYRDWVLGYLN